MTPQFPKFKYLSIEDKEELEEITGSYPPYSDFNFTSLWSWNITGAIKLCLDKENLIIQLTDYITNEPILSFLGTKSVNNTVEKLIKYAHSQGMNPQLKLIPEAVIKNIDQDKFTVVEDRANFDYIYSVEKLKTYKGSKLAPKRNYVKRFRKNYYAEIRLLDLTQPKIKESTRQLFILWAIQKNIPLSEAEHEYNAFCRFLNLKDFGQIIPLGLYIGESLAAFWFLEIVGNQYAVSHFQKADTKNYIGINPYLMQEGAKIVATKGVEFINYEQDLGIKGLREGKRDYSPIKYLEKFIIWK